MTKQVTSRKTDYLLASDANITRFVNYLILQIDVSVRCTQSQNDGKRFSHNQIITHGGIFIVLLYLGQTK